MIHVTKMEKSMIGKAMLERGMRFLSHTEILVYTI